MIADPIVQILIEAAARGRALRLAREAAQVQRDANHQADGKSTQPDHDEPTPQAVIDD